MSQAENPSVKPKAGRTQAISGLIFGVFLTLHLTNTALSALGPGWYDAVQVPLRAGYLFWAIELGLLGALVVHAITGVQQIWARRAAPKRVVPLRLRAHRWAGWFLLLVVFGHVAATRLPAIFFDAPPQFAGLSFSMWWMPFIFWPYYLALGLAGVVHGLHGVVLATGRLRIKAPRWFRSSRLYWGGVVVFGLAVWLGVASMGGLFWEVEDPRDNDYARFYESEFGVDLSRP